MVPRLFVLKVLGLSLRWSRCETRNYSTAEFFLKPVGTFNINGRRYLGNKFKLIGFIRSVVDSYCRNVQVVADLFAGTGAVAYGFVEDKIVVTNDILYSNFICNYAWLSAETYRAEFIAALIGEYNEIKVAD